MGKQKKKGLIRKDFNMKEKQTYKKILIGSTLLILTMGLTGCALTDFAKGFMEGVSESRNVSENKVLDSKKQLFVDTMEQFITCLDNQDKEGMKELFAKGVLEQDKDLDSQIERLFRFYEGNTTKNTLISSVRNGLSEHTSANRGIIVRDVSTWFYIYTDEQIYVCDTTLRITDDKGELGEGLTTVSVMTHEVTVVDGVKFPTELGLNLIEDLEGEYNIRIVSGSSYIFTDYDRTLTIEEIEAFIKEEKNMSRFRSTFGEPNVDKGYSVIYELQKEEGECRFLEVFVDEDTDRIRKAYVSNEHDNTALYYIYEEED